MSPNVHNSQREIWRDDLAGPHLYGHGYQLLIVHTSLKIFATILQFTLLFGQRQRNYSPASAQCIIFWD